MTATDLALIVVPSCIILGVVLFAVALIRSYRDWDGEPTHTFDCLDWRRHGNRDTTCTAHHGTNWFGPREHIELTTALDGQLNVGESK